MSTKDSVRRLCFVAGDMEENYWICWREHQLDSLLPGRSSAPYPSLARRSVIIFIQASVWNYRRKLQETNYIWSDKQGFTSAGCILVAAWKSYNFRWEMNVAGLAFRKEFGGLSWRASACLWPKVLFLLGTYSHFQNKTTNAQRCD